MWLYDIQPFPVFLLWVLFDFKFYCYTLFGESQYAFELHNEGPVDFKRTGLFVVGLCTESVLSTFGLFIKTNEPIHLHKSTWLIIALSGWLSTGVQSGGLRITRAVIETFY